MEQLNTVSTLKQAKVGANGSHARSMELRMTASLYAFTMLHLLNGTVIIKTKDQSNATHIFSLGLSPLYND